MNEHVSVEAQALLAAAQNERHTWETVGKAAAASVDVQWVGYNTIDVIAEELSKARAQSARLREALERIWSAATNCKSTRFSDLKGNEDTLQEMLAFARLVFAETPTQSLEAVRAEAGREAIEKKTWEIENGTSYHPENCPVTGRPFFMTIEDESGKMVATYGGPFDSYTIPEWNAEDDEFRSERYDHDAGTWVDGGEPYAIILRDEQEWLRLKTLEDEQTAIRAEAGRERAVRELEALAEAFGVTPGEVQAKDASVSYGLAKAACFISAACAKEARRRIEEIAKEGV